MNEPFWLTKEMLLSIHGELLARFGGHTGIRDAGMLDSALNRPKQVFHYSDRTSITDLAASYATGLVKNHPFVDGNKRIGFMAAYTFLGINGLQILAPEEEAVLFTRGLAADEIKEAAYAKWVTDGSEPLQD